MGQAPCCSTEETSAAVLKDADASAVDCNDISGEVGETQLPMKRDAITVQDDVSTGPPSEENRGDTGSKEEPIVPQEPPKDASAATNASTAAATGAPEPQTEGEKCAQPPAEAITDGTQQAGGGAPTTQASNPPKKKKSWIACCSSSRVQD
jgi:hypothetical protein